VARLLAPEHARRRVRPCGRSAPRPQDASGAPARGRLVGHQPALTLEWAPSRHATLALLGGAFLPGRYVRETSPGRRIGYAGSSLALRF
jgi:hypothetical protein